MFKPLYCFQVFTKHIWQQWVHIWICTRGHQPFHHLHRFTAWKVFLTLSRLKSFIIPSSSIQSQFKHWLWIDDKNVSKYFKFPLWALSGPYHVETALCKATTLNYSQQTSHNEYKLRGKTSYYREAQEARERKSDFEVLLHETLSWLINLNYQLGGWLAVNRAVVWPIFAGI